MVADKTKLSHREAMEVIGTTLKTQGVDLDTVKLSVNTVKQKRDIVRKEKGVEILTGKVDNIKEDNDAVYSLHFDGKLLKGLEHVSISQERLGVLIVGDGIETLLGIPLLEKGTAEMISEKIIEMLNEQSIPVSKIAGAVFDTTAVNSGIRSGVVKRLEDAFQKPLLQFGCRHHVAELFGGAACRVVYGPTQSPEESCFNSFLKDWTKIDTANYSVPKITDRYMKSLQDETVDFLTVFLDSEDRNSANMIRKDYRELAELTLLILGGEVPGGVTIKSPGAKHHARWMSSMIYTHKITLFRHQLKESFEHEDLKNIKALSLYLALFYVKHWLTCTNSADSPQTDLDLMSRLEEGQKKLPNEIMRRMAEESYGKMQNHLWYLSERLVMLALFSVRVSDAEKLGMVKALLKTSPTTNPVQAMPVVKLFSNTKLREYVGPNSYTFFENLGDPTPSFLKTPVPTWATNPEYLRLQYKVSTLKVVNDSAERALGLLTEFNDGKITKNEEQKQFLYQTITHMRKINKEMATSSERVTKKMLKFAEYSKTK